MKDFKVGVHVCMWPNMGSVIMLNFMLYYSCDCCGSCIGNESRTKMERSWKYACWPWGCRVMNHVEFILFNILVASL